MNTKHFKSANYSFAVMLFMGMLALASCKDDSEDMKPPAMSGMITVNDQMISQNKIWIETITMDQDGWVVIHANSGSGPMVPDIISEPVKVSKGTNSDVIVPLAKNTNIADGDAVWVMLHDDSGIIGTYEFDGSTGDADPPLMDNAGNIVMKSIKISAPSIVVSDQSVSANMIMLDEVNAAVDGWIVVHNDDGSGNITLPGIIGKTFVSAGMNTDVMIELDSMVQITAGQKLFPMLHVDDPANGMYDFPANGDGPEVFGYTGMDPNIIVTSIMVEAPTGSLEVMDQTISQNMIMVPTVTLNTAGWAVVHKSTGSGPVVPAIISKPVWVGMGTTENLMLPIKPGTSISDDEELWVMLHNDNGSIGKYEFDGASGFDGPIVVNGAVAMKNIKVMSPKITVSNQAVVDNKITIAELNAAVDGWIVVHNDDGTGNITLPGIIGKTFVEKGMHTNLVIELDNSITYTPGQKLFPMLHIESPDNDMYDFPDNGDGPEIFSFNPDESPVIIVTSFDVM